MEKMFSFYMYGTVYIPTYIVFHVTQIVRVSN
jgi:hypothetical protein